MSHSDDCYLETKGVSSSLLLPESVCVNIAVAEVDCSIADPTGKDHAIPIKTASKVCKVMICCNAVKLSCACDRCICIFVFGCKQNHIDRYVSFKTRQEDTTGRRRLTDGSRLSA